MRKLTLLLAFFLIAITDYAQLQNANWCFREYGRVDFNNAPPLATNCASGGWVPQYGGSSASVSDANGQLLFYTDGITVWNRTNNIMTNGTQLYGGADPHWNQQNVVIVPKPGSASLYYIFTVNRLYQSVPFGRGGIHYTVVDMSIGANGAVVPALKNIALKDHNGTPIDYDYTAGTGLLIYATRITSTLNNTGDKIWLEFLTRFNQGPNTQRYVYSYLIGQDGINATPDGTSPVPNTSNLLNNANYPNTANWVNDDIGSMKISPDGQYLCDVTGDAVNLYNFNNQAGTVTFNRTVYTGVPGTSNPGYGVDFAPGSQLFYFSVYNNMIIQEDPLMKLSKGVTKKYMTIYQGRVASRGGVEVIGKYLIPDSSVSDNTVPIPALQPMGDLQLALNNKVYVCSEVPFTPIHTWLGVIEYPDVAGSGCSFTPNGIQLAFGSRQEGSLPQRVHKATPLVPQTGVWVWMHGDNTISQPGVYGTQGVSAPGNKPGNRSDGISWTDNNGDFWLLGGIGGAIGVNDLYNDLWKFNVASNQWTWVKGDMALNQLGVYGIMGIPAPSNKPGARCKSFTWADQAGNLWLFGGYGIGGASSTVGPLNDLWKYNITTNQWTWVNGDNAISQLGIYGSQGVPSASNKPGSRYSGISWLDNSGNCWLYGGYGYSAQYPTALSDIWKYDVNTNSWTWFKGTNHPVNNPAPYYGIYGTQGVETGSNMPGGRFGAIGWSDNNYLYLFGGTAWMQSTIGDANDLWRYNINTNNWTWMKGYNETGQFGDYGTQGVAAATNTPGSRKWGASWKDSNGNFWTFGGHGWGKPGSTSADLNDVWKYDKNTNQWTWVHGQDVIPYAAVYGTMGVAGPTTNPGARWWSASWIDQSNNLWLLGGMGQNPNGYLNDLWKYKGSCTGPNCFAAGFARSGQEAVNQLAVIPSDTPVQQLSKELLLTNRAVAIEIFNINGQLLRKTNSEYEVSEILKSNRLAGYLPGVYILRLVYRDKTSKTIKKQLF